MWNFFEVKKQNKASIYYVMKNDEISNFYFTITLRKLRMIDFFIFEQNFENPVSKKKLREVFSRPRASYNDTLASKKLKKEIFFRFLNINFEIFN